MNERELDGALAPTPGYRYADVVGDRLFVAGQVPHDATGTLVGVDDPAAQTAQCLDNLLTLISLHGFAVADLRHLTIYVVGPREHLSAAWQAIMAGFDDDVPPATLLGVTVLGYDDQLVEIDAHIERDISA